MLIVTVFLANFIISFFGLSFSFGKTGCMEREAFYYQKLQKVAILK